MLITAVLLIAALVCFIVAANHQGHSLGLDRNGRFDRVRIGDRG